MCFIKSSWSSRRPAVSCIVWSGALLKHKRVGHIGIPFWITLDIAVGFTVAPLHEVGACLVRAPITVTIIIPARKCPFAQDENNSAENRPSRAFQSGDNF